jgi:hypothetical protein
MRGSKAKYTSKQKRQAAHIERGYEVRGASRARAERIAWATVNLRSRGGRLGGRLASRKPTARRSTRARKARS